MDVELLIASDSTGSTLYIPAIQEGIEWSTERKGVPGKLSFSVKADEALNISEGSPVRLRVNQNNIFYGFIFKRSWQKDHIIKITAYDQLRYFKNQDTYRYENLTASQFITRVITDHSLKSGTIEDTGYIIPFRSEDGITLFDMVQTALDLTLMNTKKMYVLYDDFGKLMLRGLENMYVGDQGNYLLIDEDGAEDFEYVSSIDEDTYNQVKLMYENEKTGKRDIYIAKSGESINKWGLLQYFDTLKKNENGQAKAGALLQLYNKKTQNLKVKNVKGDVRVRAGSLLCVRLNLGSGVKVANFMLVEKATHTFKENEHWMTLTLRGGDFVA